jgi:hypothetical protein
MWGFRHIGLWRRAAPQADEDRPLALEHQLDGKA